MLAPRIPLKPAKCSRNHYAQRSEGSLRVSLGGLVAALRPKKGDDLGAVFLRRDPPEGLHVVARNDLLGIGDEAVEGLLVPDEMRIGQCRGVAVAWHRTGLAADDLV